VRRSVIAGGDVIDGTGAPTARADIFIQGDVITDVRPASDVHPGWEVVDATGLTISPGFIDVHTHADNAPFLDTDDASKIRQGATTEVVGNCGISLAPVAPEHRHELGIMLQRLMPPVDFHGDTSRELFEAADARGYVTNYAPLIGLGTVRIGAMGMRAQPPTTAELRTMQSFIEEALDAGAFGISSGLIYPPSAYATTDELVALASVLRPGTLYATHMRNESDQLSEAVAEAVEVGERAKARVQISHHKASGKENWGKTKATLAFLADARTRGVDVHQDVYPYVAGSTMLTATLPPEFHEGGDEKLYAAISEPATLETIRTIVTKGRPGFENFVHMAGYDGILISGTASGNYVGKTIAEVARDLSIPEFDALIRVLRDERLKATMVIFTMDETDVARVLSDAATVVGSDSLPPGMGGNPHPRAFGTFPRVLSHYVRERKTIGFEAAIRKMTSLPASIFSIPSRGTIGPGFTGDLVAFDRNAISDDLDFKASDKPPKGIAWVMQAGEIVVKDGDYIGPRRGRRLTPNVA